MSGMKPDNETFEITGAQLIEYAELSARNFPDIPDETENAYLCPRCGGILAMKSKYLCIPCQNKYCGGCGQHLDWSGIKEEEEC